MGRVDRFGDHWIASTVVPNGCSALSIRVRRAWPLLVSAVLVLGSCSLAWDDSSQSRPQVAAFSASDGGQLSSDAQGEWLVADDGTRLPLRVWHANGGPRAIVLALHGFNDSSNAFDAPGQELAERGIATFAYDQRGFGAAPRHGRWPGTRPLVSDAILAMRLVQAIYPDSPIFLVGESMGAAIAILAMTALGVDSFAPGVQGVILAAPAVQGCQTLPFLACPVLRTTAAIMPWLVYSRAAQDRHPASDNEDV